MSQIQTVEPKIVIFEDNEPLAADLEREVRRVFELPVAIAGSTGDFFSLMEECNPYAVSIDWKVGSEGWEVGPDILDLMHESRRLQDSVSIVYTQYPVADIAMRFGADFFMPKDANLQPYLKLVGRGIHVGSLRRVRRILDEFGYSGLPELNRIDDVDLSSVAPEIGLVAAAAMVSDLPQSDALLLDEPMRHAGLLTKIDTKELLDVDVVGRARLLTKAVGADLDDLTAHLCNEQVITASANGQVDNPAFYELLRLLSFVASVAQYRIQVMRLLWEEAGLFGSAKRRPPWDEMGLSYYLLAEGRNGLEEASRWVRRS